MDSVMTDSGCGKGRGPRVKEKGKKSGVIGRQRVNAVALADGVVFGNQRRVAAPQAVGGGRPDADVDARAALRHLSAALTLIHHAREHLAHLPHQSGIADDAMRDEQPAHGPHQLRGNHDGQRRRRQQHARACRPAQ